MSAFLRRAQSKGQQGSCHVLPAAGWGVRCRAKSYVKLLFKTISIVAHCFFFFLLLGRSSVTIESYGSYHILPAWTSCNLVILQRGAIHWDTSSAVHELSYLWLAAFFLLKHMATLPNNGHQLHNSVIDKNLSILALHFDTETRSISLHRSMVCVIVITPWTVSMFAIA